MIVDELGYPPSGRDEANLFFNVVAQRNEHGSVILTSNLLKDKRKAGTLSVPKAS